MHLSGPDLPLALRSPAPRLAVAVCALVCPEWWRVAQGSAAYGRDDYIDHGCGMGREATLWLTSRGVRVCGTDAWTWDAPFKHTAERWKETGDASIIWEGHYAGIEEPYCQIEKLQNLEALPDNGFTVVCFPTKIRGGTAGWTRAVAIIED